MSLTDDLIMDMVKENQKELRVIKDNHLAHLSQDISELKTDVEVIKTRLKPIEDHVSEIQTMMRTYAQRAILLALAGVSAGSGAMML